MAYSKKSTEYQLPPVGSIIGWAKSLSNTPGIPSGWVECNGQVLSDASSVYNGVTIPALNTPAKRFLRGSTTSGTAGGADTHSHGAMAGSTNSFNASSASSYTDAGTSTVWVDNNGGGSTTPVSSASHYHYFGNASLDHSHSVSIAGTPSASTLPAYYEVVWIIRIK